MQRRDWLSLSGASLLTWTSLTRAALAQAPDVHLPPTRLAMAWRTAQPPAGQAADRVGILLLDWNDATARVLVDLEAPGRAHGLLALADGGFLAVAGRPGRWLLHCDRDGQVRQRLDLQAESPPRTFNGHVELADDGSSLYTTETDVGDGSSWISVRDPATLRRRGAWPLPGLDAHQLLCDGTEALMVAMGGLPRDAAGRKIHLDRMAPALLRVSTRDGSVLGRWTLDDPRLSLRHLAWAEPAPGQRLLGVALQAEHDQPTERQRAPVLAIWNGHGLHLPTHDAQAGGYAGDIAATDQGLVLSSEKTGRALLWQPQRPGRLQLVAQLGEVCALATAPQDGALVLGARLGLGRWSTRTAANLIAWPPDMAPDNHAVVLA